MTPPLPPPADDSPNPLLSSPEPVIWEAGSEFTRREEESSVATSARTEWIYRQDPCVVHYYHELLRKATVRQAPEDDMHPSVCLVCLAPIAAKE